MKKSFLGVWGLVLSASVLSAIAEETAFEGQPIGTIALNPSTKSTLVAVSFKELSPNDGAEITAANLVSTKNLSNGDTLHVYQGGIGYKVWRVQDGKWVAPVAKVSLTADGDAKSEPGTDASAVSAQTGTGFWLVRQSTGNPFYIYGRYVGANTTEAAAGALSLIGNPTPDKTTPTISGANDGDRIGLVAQDGGLLDEYTYRSDKGWTQYEKVSGGYPQEVVKTITIPSGLGFWYNSTGSEKVKFSW